MLTNDTNAANSAQQYSPSLIFRGRGWKTNATAASQTVDFQMGVRSVQGAANPTGNFVIQSSINGAAYADIFTLSNLGTISSVLSYTLSGGQAFNSNGLAGLGGTTTDVFRFYPASNLTATSGTVTMISAGWPGAFNFAPTSGTAVFKGLIMQETINQTGGANGNVHAIVAEPVLTAAGGNVNLFYANPTVTSVSGYLMALNGAAGATLS